MSPELFGFISIVTLDCTCVTIFSIFLLVNSKIDFLTGHIDSNHHCHAFTMSHEEKKNGKYIFTTNKIDFILKFVVVILTIPFICKAKAPIAHAHDCQAKKKTKKSRAAFVYVSVCVSVQNLYVELASSDFVLSGSKLKHSFK